MKLFENQEEHPSYGQLQISKISSNQRVPLYGTSNQCREIIRLSITRSKLCRDLSRSWFFQTEELIQIDMSPAQFAEAITSLNQGSGTPVTLRRVLNERYDSPPYKDERDLFDKEFKEDVHDIMGATNTLIDEAKKVLNQKTVTKTSLKDLINKLEQIQKGVRSSIPFVAQSFNEHIEKSVSSAKIEIETYIDSKIRSAGMEALKNNIPQSNLLEDKNENDKHGD